MDENVIVTTFSQDSRAYEALARFKELAAARHEATVEKVQAKLHELREPLRHLVHH